MWIDHRRAFLVLLNQVANSITIDSDASRRPAAPGEAKNGLKSHLLRDARGSKLAIELDNGDKMTDAQIIARVREHFQL